MFDRNYMFHLKSRPKFYHEFMVEDVDDFIDYLEETIEKLKMVDTKSSPQNINNMVQKIVKNVSEEAERISDHFDSYMHSKDVLDVVTDLAADIVEYDANTAKLFKGLFDVASPQETANITGCTVMNGSQAFQPKERNK